jgi:hypothetical protein
VTEPALDEYTTSLDDFEYYKQCCKKFSEMLCLDGGWEFYFEHSDIPKDYAWCAAQTDARNVTLGLKITWGEVKPTKKLISKTAFHEITELLLRRLSEQAESAVADKLVEETRHEVIHILEKVIWKPYWDKYRK